MILIWIFLTTFSGGPKTAMESTQGQLLKMYPKKTIKAKIWCRVVEVTVCKFFEQLQFLHDTVSNEESAGNIDIEYAQRASPNSVSDVIKAEVNGNVLVEKEVSPPEMKRKVEPYRKLTSGKSK